MLSTQNSNKYYLTFKSTSQIRWSTKYANAIKSLWIGYNEILIALEDISKNLN